MGLDLGFVFFHGSESRSGIEKRNNEFRPEYGSGVSSEVGSGSRQYQTGSETLSTMHHSYVNRALILKEAT